MQGLQVGQGIGDALITQPAQAQAAAEAKRLDMAQRQAMQQELMTLQKDPSQARARDLLLRFPQLKEQVGGFMTSFNDEQKKSYLSEMEESAGFLISGNTQMASERFKRRAEAAKNSGNAREADAMTRLAEDVLVDPAAVRAQLQMRIEALDPEAGKRLSAFEESRSKVRKEGVEADKIVEETKIKAEEAKIAARKLAADLQLTEAQAKRYADQTELVARRLGLEDRQLREQTDARIAAAKRADIELSEKQQGLMTDAALAAEVKTVEADALDSVATAFEVQDRNDWEKYVNTGVFGAIGEGVNTLRGREGVMTRSRLQYKRYVQEDIKRKNKGQGALSDGDRRAAEATYPDPVGDPAGAAAFVRQEEARVRREAMIDDAKAQWIAQNGGLGPAKAPIAVGGEVVGKGDTFQDVMKKIGQAKPTKAAGGKRSGSGQRAEFDTAYGEP
jgi:hypothetical protein